VKLIALDRSAYEPRDETGELPASAPAETVLYSGGMLSIHHVSLSVASLAASLRFYIALGFSEVLRWEAEDGTLVIVHLKLGAFVLELFNYSAPAPGAERSLDDDLRVIGVRHFALRTASIERTREVLVRDGFSIYRDITEGRTGIKYLFLRDPDGIFVEVVEDNRAFMPLMDRED
jgi:glyoxylase I family protein